MYRYSNMSSVSTHLCVSKDNLYISDVDGIPHLCTTQAAVAMAVALFVLDYVK